MTDHWAFVVVHISHPVNCFTQVQHLCFWIQLCVMNGFSCVGQVSKFRSSISTGRIKLPLPELLGNFNYSGVNTSQHANIQNGDHGIGMLNLGAFERIKYTSKYKYKYAFTTNLICLPQMIQMCERGLISPSSLDIQIDIHNIIESLIKPHHIEIY